MHRWERADCSLIADWTVNIACRTLVKAADPNDYSCSSAVARLGAHSMDAEMLKGSGEIWRVLFDIMAQHLHRQPTRIPLSIQAAYRSMTHHIKLPKVSLEPSSPRLKGMHLQTRAFMILQHCSSLRAPPSHLLPVRENPLQTFSPCV